jgi:hypothetical protein
MKRLSLQPFQDEDFRMRRKIMNGRRRRLSLQPTLGDF